MAVIYGAKYAAQNLTATQKQNVNISKITQPTKTTSKSSSSGYCPAPNLPSATGLQGQLAHLYMPEAALTKKLGLVSPNPITQYVAGFMKPASQIVLTQPRTTKSSSIGNSILDIPFNVYEKVRGELFTNITGLGTALGTGLGNVAAGIGTGAGQGVSAYGSGLGQAVSDVGSGAAAGTSDFADSLKGLIIPALIVLAAIFLIKK